MKAKAGRSAHGAYSRAVPSPKGKGCKYESVGEEKEIPLGMG